MAAARMNQCPAAWLLRRLSAIPRLRGLALNLAFRLEGRQFYSLTARWILAKYYGVEIGHYSYGECFVPGAFPAGVKVGRYVSIGPGVRVFMRNHPMDRLSTHPFFYNRALGFVPKDNIDFGKLDIGHDVWIGAGAIILRGCSKIGMGAIIGAGAVVTKDVPDFGVAGGNPARIIRMRFPENICKRIQASRWWLRSAKELRANLAEMTSPLGTGEWLRPPSHPQSNKPNNAA